ncbi:MAG: hypothetical protein AMJ43_09435 [Coxiella sp. DG_40]|nr:MAG: hypothetical protein AMJ43_09435 [Coxiella sp. DG_40]
MTEDKNSLRLDAVGEQIREPLKLFAEKLIAGLGDNLQSITVVGSSLTEDFKPGQSDINTVLVLAKQTLSSLNTIASLAKPIWLRRSASPRRVSKKKISAPLLMTPSYIERSRDVFAVEFLDFQLNHQTVLGSDPFASLSFDKKDVRLQCERELKATLIRLRQGYIASAANKKLVRDILISAAKGLAPLLRALLWLKDIDRPPRAEPTFRKAASEFSLNMDCLLTAGKWRHEKVRLSESEMENAFESVYATVDQLALTVDKLEV